MKNKSIKYEDIYKVFSKHKLDFLPAELHGIETGLLCANAGESLSNIREILFRELNCDAAELAEDARDLVSSFIAYEYNEIVSSFEGINLSFRLFLPDDEAPLSERVTALGDWCQGFLGGLGLAGLDEKSLAAKSNVEEAINDISKFAQLNSTYVTSLNSLESSDVAIEEDSYIELVEYITVIAQDVHAELNL